jgi:predicted metalloprotease with PDZ domain
VRPAQRPSLVSVSLCKFLVVSCAWLLFLAIAGISLAQEGVTVKYCFSIPEPQHHWMQVEASFAGLDAAPLELRMSRSSPGRYSLHDFAKNVYDVHAVSSGGTELILERPDESGWTLAEHGPAVVVRYKVYGDRVDGTYLAIDRTHVHMNMPAAILWARGLGARPVELAFEAPESADWRIATQLYPGSTPLEFTAPSLDYLMDSPVEFGPIVLRAFTIGPRAFRFAVHHTGSETELDGFVADIEKIVRQEEAIYGEFPEYEPGTYTFLADYLPYASGDGMEHRNSTVMTANATIRRDRTQLLDTAAHEFFHCWNVERIRPQSLEPFDLDRANMSSELWLAEGFTQYYGPLVLERAGLVDLPSTLGTLTSLVDGVTNGPGRLVRSAEESSRMAPFIDGGRPLDRVNWRTTVVSYYTFGAAVALALDLELRARSDSRTTLDDYMRAMWQQFGKPGGTRPGLVDRPYTDADAETVLAEVSGDRAFAHDFFARYVHGHEAADYGPLLARAGLLLRRRNSGRAWWGDVDIAFENGAARVAALVPPHSPAYDAGLEQDDELRTLDGERIGSADQVVRALSRHRPGDSIDVGFADRTGEVRHASLTLAADPHLEIVPVETSGGSLTPAERSFRARWLAPSRSSYQTTQQ